MKASELIRAALKEDLGAAGDLTTRYFVPAGTRLKGRIVAKAPGVICGTEIAAAVFKAVDRRCRVNIHTKDGCKVRPGQSVLSVSGGRGLLSAERTALNFLQHLSGIATMTARYAEKVRGTRAKVYDTRKTLPGWRELAKYAVRCGGGRNHRFGLYDAVLVKDNHWDRGVDVRAAAASVRRDRPKALIEIEAASENQVRRALAAAPDVILLDNMGAPALRRAISLIRKTSRKVQIEVSGNVNLDTIGGIARLGPDRISIGRLTHSAPALDMSLELA